MNKNNFLINLQFLLNSLLLLLFLASQATASEKPRNNVLFIIADDLNCYLGTYGHDTVKTPNIDKLASEGRQFDRAYCQYPICGASRASFMTGLYPDQTGIRKNGIRIRETMPDVQTMAQLFRNNGYTTTRVGKIFHYGVPTHIGTDGHDDPASWDNKFNPKGRDKDDEAKIFSVTPGKFGGSLSWLVADGDDKEQTDAIGASNAIETLEKHAKDQSPFFLAVGLYRPHTPYVAPKAYFDMYPIEEISVPKIPQDYLKSLPLPTRRTLTLKKQHANLSDDLVRQAIQGYFASITFADAQVGRILKALKELKLDRNTIVVFTSDHGYHMGEHGHFMKSTVFENATRVPLIIRTPNMQQPGVKTKALAEMVDFYPTLADLCHLQAPKNLQGISLTPVIKDPNKKVRESALSQTGKGYSIRTARYRYTEWGEKGINGIEFYDHENDPEEMHNLADSTKAKKIIERLSIQLRQRKAQVQKKPIGLTKIARVKKK